MHIYLIGDNVKIFDAHNDLLTQKTEVNNYLNKFYKQGLSSAIFAIFLSERNLTVNQIIELAKKINNNYFAIEDISYIPFDQLNKLKKIKPLYCSLTWNECNNLAGGCNSNQDITPLGYKYIEKIEKFSYIDTSHLNEKSFYSLAKYSKKPLLNSHTNLYKFNKHKRNITNKQIKTIIKSNGLVCLTGVKDFLGKNSTLDTYINSIYYFYKKFGSNNLALATDFLESDKYPLVYKGYRDFRLIYNKLKAKGIKEHDLNKIFYLNAINFFKIKDVYE